MRWSASSCVVVSTMVDYARSGTAIRQSPDPQPTPPVLTDLSGQEYWKLATAGWAPAGLVAATTVFFVSQSTRARWGRRAAGARGPAFQRSLPVAVLGA